MSSYLAITLIGACTIILSAWIVSRSRCNQLDLCGCIHIQRDTGLEHDIELSEIRDAVSMILPGGASRTPHSTPQAAQGQVAFPAAEI